MLDFEIQKNTMWPTAEVASSVVRPEIAKSMIMASQWPSSASTTPPTHVQLNPHYQLLQHDSDSEQSHHWSPQISPQISSSYSHLMMTPEVTFTTGAAASHSVTSPSRSSRNSAHDALSPVGSSTSLSNEVGLKSSRSTSLGSSAQKMDIVPSSGGISAMAAYLDHHHQQHQSHLSHSPMHHHFANFTSDDATTLHTHSHSSVQNSLHQNSIGGQNHGGGGGGGNTGGNSTTATPVISLFKLKNFLYQPKFKNLLASSNVSSNLSHGSLGPSLLDESMALGSPNGQQNVSAGGHHQLVSSHNPSPHTANIYGRQQSGANTNSVSSHHSNQSNNLNSVNSANLNGTNSTNNNNTNISNNSALLGSLKFSNSHHMASNGGNGAATTTLTNTSTSSRKYQCKMCPQFFFSKADMQLHTQVHMREAKPYKCSQCPKTFANSSYLSQHSRIHLGIKPYRCEICGRKFTQLSHLQQHLRTHTGDKPYRCRFPSCTKAFSQLSNLQSHSRSHQTDKPFKCNSCYKSFPDEAGLLEHIPKHKESKHLKTHICQFCGKSYTQETYLAKHMAKHADRMDGKTSSRASSNATLLGPSMLSANNQPPPYSWIGQKGAAQHQHSPPAPQHSSQHPSAHHMTPPGMDLNHPSNIGASMGVSSPAEPTFDKWTMGDLGIQQSGVSQPTHSSFMQSARNGQSAMYFPYESFNFGSPLVASNGHHQHPSIHASHLQQQQQQQPGHGPNNSSNNSQQHVNNKESNKKNSASNSAQSLPGTNGAFQNQLIALNQIKNYAGGGLPTIASAASAAAAGQSSAAQAAALAAASASSTPTLNVDQLAMKMED